MPNRIPQEFISKSSFSRNALLGISAAGAMTGAGALAYYKFDLTQMVFDGMSATGPMLRLLDPEDAHMWGIFFARMGLFPKDSRADPSSLKINVFNKEFKNPLGLAAGFDKNGEVVKPMLNLGFGFVEAGTVTPVGQPGNEQPRCWRLPKIQAVVNRMGFNNKGAEEMARNLRSFRQAQERDDWLKKGMLGVNIGKNKVTSHEDAYKDYQICSEHLVEFADYMVINVSSPNTPGLRALQSKNELVKLIQTVRDVMNKKGCEKLALLVKISPDLSENEMADVAEVALSEKVDGLIVTNTTISRPDQYWNQVDSSQKEYVGGLSGRPLKELSTKTISTMYKLTNGKIPIIGSGGVENGRDAYEKIKAGASLIQVYTAMIYQGISVVPNIKQQLAKCLLEDGYQSLSQAVGADHKA
eukprot:TRINITY_DN5790_c0_g1_i1.p1 TRINITY_DN5790_c0_g1~~TRINITY_DN5790_c0_g1_i1.p1  ORF type:complete len:425 (-),score=54.77 TRINITY_DN5790_c0_g1_i1:309-1547(-)